MAFPRGAHQEHRGALPRGKRGDDVVQLWWQVAGPVRLDEPHRAGQVCPVAQGPVDDQQVVVGSVLPARRGASVLGGAGESGAGGEGGNDLDLSKGLLQRVGESHCQRHGVTADGVLGSVSAGRVWMSMACAAVVNRPRRISAARR